jgi:ABC-2 type transport system permease protein
MILAPGSTPWLMRHELRLSWRRLMARGAGRPRPFRAILLVLLLPLLLLVGAGLPLSFAVRDVQIPVVPIASAIAVLASVAIFTLMLSQTLSAAVDALYERADLDLLFSSPMRPRRVLTVRFLAVAVQVYAFYLLLTAPILLPTIVLYHPAWIGLEVVLFAIALAATGSGLLIAWALFRLVGPRRTRTFGQVLAAMTGAGAFLLGQSYNLLGRHQSASLWADLVRRASEPAFRPPPGLDWPLRAMLGQPLPLALVSATGVGLFLLANQVLGPRFAADAAAAAGVGTAGARRRGPGARARFATGAFSATLAKELRLIVRDPALISQVLLRVLYIVPLGFVLLRNAGEARAYALPGGAAVLSLMAGQVVGSLAWITVSAEDAPDLLSCSPTPMSILRRAKLAAAILPVAVLLLVVLIPLTVMAPWVGVAASLGCLASMATVAALNIWWQRPGRRSEFRRVRQGSILVTLAELLLGLLIAAATALFAGGLLLLALIPAALVAVVVALLRRSDAQIAEALGRRL